MFCCGPKNGSQNDDGASLTSDSFGKGDVSPSFKLKTIEGDTFDSAKECKQNRLLLIFLRHLVCRYCESHEFRGDYRDASMCRQFTKIDRNYRRWTPRLF
jgi:hypothetical protein